MIQVFIADDHEVVREGLKRILSKFSDMRIAGEAADADALLTEIQASGADVLLLDITMPGPGVVELLATLGARQPSLRTLVLSVHPESDFAIRILRAGALGYLRKDRSAAELGEAIRRVYQGGRYVSPELVEKLVMNLDPNSSRAPHERLSDREYQIFCMLGSGKSVKQISQQLDLSPKTVSTHRARILQKTGLESNADIVRYVVKKEIVL